jgi:hypothetical protein
MSVLEFLKCRDLRKLEKMLKKYTDFAVGRITANQL